MELEKSKIGPPQNSYSGVQDNCLNLRGHMPPQIPCPLDTLRGAHDLGLC